MGLNRAEAVGQRWRVREAGALDPKTGFGRDAAGILERAGDETISALGEGLHGGHWTASLFTGAGPASIFRPPGESRDPCRPPNRPMRRGSRPEFILGPAAGRIRGPGGRCRGGGGAADMRRDAVAAWP